MARAKWHVIFDAMATQVGRKRVRRPMAKMGLEPIYQRPRTTIRHPGHQIYLYLLREMVIDRPNQVSDGRASHIAARRSPGCAGRAEPTIAGHRAVPRAPDHAAGPCQRSWLISVAETALLVCASPSSNCSRRPVSVLLVSFGNSGYAGIRRDEIGDASPNRSIC
jgi:hypothetical protein